MLVKTFSRSELQDFDVELTRQFSFEPSCGLKGYFDGLEFKTKEEGDPKGIHYFQGLGYERDGCRKFFILALDLQVQKDAERGGDFYCPEDGGCSSKKYISRTIPVQGMVELSSYSDRVEMHFVEVHSEFRNRKILNLLLEELVRFLKQENKKLVRSRVSEKAPSWLKPKIDKLLNDNKIEWSQEQGFI